jgi:SH3-like domain-containing protein
MKVVALFFTALLLAGPAFAEMVTVTVAQAELRDKPAVSGAKVVATLPLATPLEVRDSQDRYLQVKDFKGTVGWLHATLVGKSPAVVITKDSVNVRKGPGTEHTVAFKGMRGEAYQMLDQQGVWVRIGGQKEERSGWISKTLLWGL